jgi:hypothetical protein
MLKTKGKYKQNPKTKYTYTLRYDTNIMLEEKTIKEEGRFRLHGKKHLLIQFKGFYFIKSNRKKSKV